jgi:hypothetical protein
MLVPTHEREDRTIPVITLGLDGVNTHQEKKAKCFICGNTVFKYRDTLKFAFPIDIVNQQYDEKFGPYENALDEVECTALIRTSKGRRACRTVYIITRPPWTIENLTQENK